MNEYHENVGKRAELRREEKRLVYEAGAVRDRMRSLLDPLCDPDQLNTEEIGALGVALSELCGELAGVRANLDRIAQIIGR